MPKTCARYTYHQHYCFTDDLLCSDSLHTWKHDMGEFSTIESIRRCSSAQSDRFGSSLHNFSGALLDDIPGHIQQEADALDLV